MDMLAFSYKTGDFLSPVSCKCIIPMGLGGKRNRSMELLLLALMEITNYVIHLNLLFLISQISGSVKASLVASHHATA